MGSSALPPPASSAPTPGGPGGGNPSAPAPGDSGQKAAQQLELVRNIVTSGRLLAQMSPATAPIVRQINQLVQQLQQKLVSSAAPAESQAPPS